MQLNLILDWAFSLMTLTLLEIILGIDNLIFISIIITRLPKHERNKARKIGLSLAWLSRLGLLFSAVWLTHLTHPLFQLFTLTFSARDVFLGIGGLFLLVKVTREIHLELDSLMQKRKHSAYVGLFSTIIQIIFLDILLSLDSIITAVGLTSVFWVMATAITIAIIIMFLSSEPLSQFIAEHPSIKMLAFSFLILIGTVLVADSLHFHIPRGYIYFTLAFSVLVESLNFIHRKHQKR